MPSNQSARLDLPYLAAGQLQKHVTVNEALTRLDALAQTAVVSRSVAAQPAAPDDGDLHILPASPTGAVWSGWSEGDLVRAEMGGFRPFRPFRHVAFVLTKRTNPANPAGRSAFPAARASKRQNLPGEKSG